MTAPPSPAASPRTEDRREALVEILADHVLAEGLPATSLRVLARAAGTSDRMLLYYFPDKAALVAAVLERLAQRLVPLLDARQPTVPLPPQHLLADLLSIVEAPEVWPYMQVWLEIAAAAGRGDATCRAVGEKIARGFVAWVEARLDRATTADPAETASRLFVAVEGMVLLRAVGLDDVSRTAVLARS